MPTQAPKRLSQNGYVLGSVALADTCVSLGLCYIWPTCVPSSALALRGLGGQGWFAGVVRLWVPLAVGFSCALCPAALCRVSLRSVPWGADGPWLVGGGCSFLRPVSPHLALCFVRFAFGLCHLLFTFGPLPFVPSSLSGGCRSPWWTALAWWAVHIWLERRFFLLRLSRLAPVLACACPSLGGNSPRPSSYLFFLLNPTGPNSAQSAVSYAATQHSILSRTMNLI